MTGGGGVASESRPRSRERAAGRWHRARTGVVDLCVERRAQPILANGAQMSSAVVAGSHLVPAVHCKRQAAADSDKWLSGAQHYLITRTTAPIGDTSAPTGPSDQHHGSRRRLGRDKLQGVPADPVSAPQRQLRWAPWRHIAIYRNIDVKHFRRQFFTFLGNRDTNWLGFRIRDFLLFLFERDLLF